MANAWAPSGTTGSAVGGVTRGSRRPQVDDSLADPATGFYGVGPWLEVLPQAHNRWTRYSRPFVLAQIEVAGIAQIAVRLGAGTAEQLVNVLAAVLQDETRASDQYARLPPWRIQGVLHETDPGRAIAYVTRLRHGFTQRLGPGIPIGLLVGLAGPEPGADLARILLAAEEAMYENRRPPT